MADQQQIARLKEGVAAWNAWRAARRDVTPDLAGAPLRGLDLGGVDLEGANLAGAQFLNCAQLESALAWPSAARDADLACGQPIPE